VSGEAGTRAVAEVSARKSIRVRELGEIARSVGAAQARAVDSGSRLGSMAAGHALAVALAVAVALTVGRAIPPSLVRWLVAVCLVTVGVHRLVRMRHPRYGGMSMNGWHLTIWSLLMASVHGAGLMVVPFVLGEPPVTGTHTHHAVAQGASVLPLGSAELAGLDAAMIHTAGYLLVTGLVAVLVYEKLGLRLLRTAWVNLDLVWSGVLIATAVALVIW
jgi:hypothetical protein